MPNPPGNDNNNNHGLQAGRVTKNTSERFSLAPMMMGQLEYDKSFAYPPSARPIGQGKLIVDVHRILDKDQIGKDGMPILIYPSSFVPFLRSTMA